MNYNEKQILEIAKKVLKDIHGEHYDEAHIQKAFFVEKEELARGPKKGQVQPCWGVAVDALFGNSDYLTISDETGEPLYYQNSNMLIGEVQKDPSGKYFTRQ